MHRPDTAFARLPLHPPRSVSLSLSGTSGPWAISGAIQISIGPQVAGLQRTRSKVPRTFSGGLGSPFLAIFLWFLEDTMYGSTYLGP